MKTSSLATDARRNRVSVHHAPVDPEGIAAVAEDPTDVVRAVRELVSRIGVPPPAHAHAIEVARAVGMDQPADQLLGMRIDYALLPIGEHDGTLVLAALPVLRQQARPLLGVRADVDDVLGRIRAHRDALSDHRFGGQRNPPRNVDVHERAVDRQAEDVAGEADHVPVAEVGTQDVGVVAGRRRRVVVLGMTAPCAGGHRLVGCPSMPPFADRAPWDSAFACDGRVVQALGQEPVDLVHLSLRTHVRKLRLRSDATDTRGGIRTHMSRRTAAFEAAA
jgi:hypothetical protein